MGSWFILIANAYLVSKHIGYGVVKQITDLIPIAIISSVTYLAVYLIIANTTINIYIEAIIALSLYILIYVGLSYKFRIRAFSFLMEMMRTYKTKFVSKLIK